MALPKQTIPLPLATLDMGHDALSGAANTFSVLDNVVQDKNGRWRSRGPMTTMVATSIDNAWTLPAVGDILTSGDNLAVRTRDGQFASYSQSVGKWAQGAWIPRASVRSDILHMTGTVVRSIAGTRNVEICDSVMVNGQLWVVWSEEYNTVVSSVPSGVAGRIWVSCYDLGTAGDAVTGAVLLDAYEITATTWTVTNPGQTWDVGGYGCLPHLTKYTRAAGDAVLLSVVMKVTTTNERILCHFRFSTSNPQTAPVPLASAAQVTNAGGSAWAKPCPYDVMETYAGTVGQTTVVAVTNTYMAATWAVHMMDVEGNLFYPLALGSDERADIGYHWLTKLSSQTAYATLAAIGSDASGCIDGLVLYRVKLVPDGGANYEVDGAATTIKGHSTDVGRVVGYSESGVRDYFAVSYPRSHDDGTGTNTSVFNTEWHYQSYSDRSIGLRKTVPNVMPTSRAFNRSGTTEADWTCWLTYVGSNLPASCGAYAYSGAGATELDIQQTYFAAHLGSTPETTRTMVPPAFTMMAKAHQDQGLLQRYSNAKTSHAYGGTAWVTNATQATTPDYGHKPVSVAVLPRVPATGEAALAAVRVDWDGSDLGELLPMGKTWLVPGGMVDVYDGRSATDGARITGQESMLRPEVPGLTVVTTGGLAGVSTGAHQVCVTWSTTDQDGKEWESAPSGVNTVTVSDAERWIRVHIQNPGIIAADYLTVRAYATTVGGSLFYYAGKTTVTINTVVAAATIDITDTDAGLQTGATLYTDSGELPNDCTQPAAVIAQWKNRAWAVGCENRNEIRFSKELDATHGARWSDAFVIDMQGPDGEITAVAPLGDRLLIFKRRSIYALAGDGPDATGDGWYPRPELITNQVGAVNPRSVIVVPEGVIFCAETGIYLANAGGGVVELGAPINADLRALDGEGSPVRIVGAAAIPNTQLVAFLPRQTGGGATALNASVPYLPACLYVFDRGRGCWYTWGLWSGGGCLGATSTNLLIGDKVSSLFASYLWQYTHALSYQYDTQVSTKRRFNCQWESQWLSPGELGGYERLYEIQIMGLPPTGTTGWSVSALVEYAVDSGLNGTLGSGTSYFDTLTYAGSSRPAGSGDYATIKIKPKYQKNSRFKVRLLGVGSTSHTTFNFQFVSMALVVGGKGGLQRVPITNIAT